MPEREPMSKIVRQLRAGQITIPAQFRKELGITPESFLKLTVIDGELRITPVHVAEPGRRVQALRELYDYFAPVRQEARDKGYSEEEINDTIDQAVKEVRQQHNHASRRS
jgi:AbrB family looped-hinge helix DNA binding protein